MWFCKKEKFSITDEDIEKALKGHNFSYSGDMPQYFMEVVRKYKNTVDAYESIFKALFKDMPENTKNNSQCISCTTLKHLKCLQQDVTTIQEESNE